MNASKELIITSILTVLAVMTGSFLYLKSGPKILKQHIISTMDQVNTVRNYMGDYPDLVDTGDYQGTNFYVLKTKEILPSNIKVIGTDDDSMIRSPFDEKQTMNIKDPNKSSSSLQGRYYEIKIDSSNSKFTAVEKQTWEQKMKKNLESGGGVVTGYDVTNADAILTVRYE